MLSLHAIDHYVIRRSANLTEWRIPPLVVCLLTLVPWLGGCATPLTQFGDHARYSPAFRSYVLAVHNGSDDPAVGEPVLVLRDPLTGDKLRCREEVTQWRELAEDLAADKVEDDNGAVTAAATTGAVFAPLLALHPVGSLVTVEAMLFGHAVYGMLASADPLDLLVSGIAQYRRKRYRQAAAHLERALSKDPALGIVDRAYYFLGLAYRKLGNRERARLALWLFVTRSGVRDVNAYRKAEAALRALGADVDRCRSTKPVQVYW